MAKMNNARICMFNGKLLTLDIPAYTATAVQAVVDKSTKLHNDYCKLVLDTPRRPRTTGRGSQNNAVRGVARQIHEHCGQGIDSILEYAKCKAADEGVIPFLVDGDGKTVINMWGYARGTSESTWSVEEATGVIKILIAMADDMDIRLEGFDDRT